MTDASAALEPRDVKPSLLALAARWRIFAYLSALIAIIGLGDPNEGLLNLPVSFLLKNKLQLPAHEMADFRLISALPFYFAAVFGFIRDSWHPFGMRDRGYMIVFSLIGCALNLVFAFTPVSTASLLAALLSLSIAFLFVSSAQNGLSSTLGQQHAMTGRVSVVWSIFGMLPSVSAFALGGKFSDWLEDNDPDLAARTMFLAGAAMTGLMLLYALWRPGVVYDNVHHEDPDIHRPRADLARLAKHWPIYPALVIWMLWNFNPGASTPLQYHLQNQLHGTDGDWGVWNALYWGCYIPTFLLYGLLCRRFALGKLLFWGTVVAVPQFAPLLFVHSVNDAMIAAVPIGLMGGMANAAYLDLLIRSCPPGLQGTVLMMSTALYYLATRVGDVWGTRLYENFGGFEVCVAMTMLVYAAILPILWLIPKALTATMDGEVAEAKTSGGESALSLTCRKS
ncbi:MFS transporter [uncultured Rhodoblastus sp.]|uniref:MFS transporter n=1 Tax=uncultured Rhodoblastus sp. TaxID=543037 RepID=UPI0025ED969D|nr:MFS transporter [uncultured Rhodoblastus sp.]